MGCFESKESDDRTDRKQVRGCTDIVWLIIYCIFWIVMLVIAVFAVIYADPKRIINGFDSFGNTCGVKNNEKWQGADFSGQSTIDRPYLFFLDIKELRQSLKICVKECPTRDITSANGLLEYYNSENTKYCHYNFSMNDLAGRVSESDSTIFDTLGPCPKLPVYRSKPKLHRCIPSGENAPLKEVRELYGLINKWDIVQQLLADLYKTWPTVLMLCGFSLVLSIILIGLLHYLTQIISWLICIFVVVASVGITVVLWMTYYDIKNNKNNETLSQLSQFVRNETGIYVLAILATILLIFLLVTIYFMSSKFTGLAALFEEAGKCMYDLPGLFGLPILATIVLAIFLTFWVLIVICLATSNIPGIKPLVPLTQLIQSNVTNSNLTLIESGKKLLFKDNLKRFSTVEYSDVPWLRHMFWFYVIGLIWGCEFIFACQDMALAGSVAYWYFKKPTDSPITDSITKLMKYHLGSIAKGSFIITIFKIPRLILTYLYAKLKAASTQGSECASCGLKSCICCFWLLEKFIRYLNHNAYVVIAIESINFCPAAGVAFNAMFSNIIQVGVINGIGDFILFLGKVAVAGVCGLIALLMLKNREDVDLFIVPVVLVIIFTFAISHIILSLYEIVVDSLFLCICEDKTINGPTGRWKQSNLAHLLGEEPADAVEAPMQEVELRPINKQPFSTHA